MALITTLRQPPPATSPSLPVAAPKFDGRVVYRSAEGEIVVADLADGSERVVGAGNEPALSPDGTKIAFVRIGEQPGIWVLDLRTGEEQRVATENGARSPIWSADGTRLAILKTRQDPVRGTNPATRRSGWFLENHFSVVVVDVASRTTTDLPSMTFSSFPSFSPDGTELVFDGNIGLFVVPTNGSGEPVLVPNTNRLFSQPAWSPDGTRFAVTFKRNDNVDIGVINRDGSGFQLVTESPFAARQANNVAPVWSPDGSRIAFLSDRDGVWQLYTLDLATRTVQPLLTHDLGVAFSFSDERAVSWGR
ncbi:MAG: LpqB family beta-propeller domain-containing protein [Dehalococcoidia bacterium]